jgi:predicted peroxiredoxin
VVLDHSPPFSDLLASVLADGSVTLCTQCAARRGITEADLTDGVRIAGAATFVAEVTADATQALVY